MNGIALYRRHPARRGDEQAPIIWQQGTTRLRDYAPGSSHAPVILVVPSLINRFTILDLHPRHSFLRQLAMHGFRPLVVDWDVPQEEEKHFSLSDYVTERLIPALNIAAAESAVHVTGYCMGGNLALALSVLCPKKIRSLSLLATPWDFHAGFAARGQDGQGLKEKLAPWLKTDDFLPVEVVQSVFTAFQPLHALRKFSHFAALDQSSDEATRFVLTEDWLNDGVSLTANAARECFDDWCGQNMTVKGGWQIDGRLIDPKVVTVPTYVVIAGKDRIVPPESAHPLTKMLPRVTCHEPMMGHIGIIAGQMAAQTVWEPLIEWMSNY